MKEDRRACPCALNVDVSGLPAYPVQLALRAGDFQEQRTAARDTTFRVMAPKSGVLLVAVSGTALPEGEVISIPPGFDCPPLYLQSEWVETAADTARVRVQLHKHFCTLSLTVTGPPGWGEPYWTEIRGRVGGLTLEGEPREGSFLCRLDSGSAIRLPRQDPEGELWLDITMPDCVVRSFALGHYMLEAGYDWTAPDLEDLPLQLDLSVTAISFRMGNWSTVIPLDVEI